MTAAFRKSSGCGKLCSAVATAGCKADTASTISTEWSCAQRSRTAGSASSAGEYHRRYKGLLLGAVLRWRLASRSTSCATLISGRRLLRNRSLIWVRASPRSQRECGS
jgi:hypothetical protein